jgi:hypothetical protein
MDADLIAEMKDLKNVYDEQGIQMFRYACHDGWVREIGGLPKSPLFRCSTPSGREEFHAGKGLCGGPIEVKTQNYPVGPHVAWLNEWTEAIRDDERIPIGMPSIEPGELVAFAEWQMRFRDYFRAEGLMERLPEYVELSKRWP